MTEQKRRGRPPKRERLDVEADIGTLDRPPYVAERVSAAQAYADRVWAGQSISTLRSWRIERVKAALEGQNLPFDGVELPE